MQAVGQLDEDHPAVVGHRQQHLVKVLRPGLFPGWVEFDLSSLERLFTSSAVTFAEPVADFRFFMTVAFPHHVAKQAPR